jgi:hypothetical protein
MGAWCSNCHGNYHNNGAMLVHPSGVALGDIAATYNAYNGSSDQNGGVEATAYLAAVPFEDENMTPSSTAGPSATSQVSCITCHRAHGTSSPNIGRWDFNVDIQGNDGQYAYRENLPAPYNAYGQRSLCNKCHNQDVGDHIATQP